MSYKRVSQSTFHKKKVLTKKVMVHKVGQVLKPLTASQVKASVKGMDSRVAGWKVGNLRVYLLYSQIWNRYWTRVENAKGALVKGFEGEGFQYESHSSEDALNKLGDAFLKAKNSSAAKFFKAPKIQALKQAQKEDAEKKTLKAKALQNPLASLFLNKFNFKSDGSLEEKLGKAKYYGGAVMNEDGSAGLILDDSQLGRKGVWSAFLDPQSTFDFKFTPSIRAKFNGDWKKRNPDHFIIGNQIYKGDLLYNAMMVLSSPLTASVEKKMGLLLLSDAKGAKIILAPVRKSELEINDLLASMPITKYVGGAPYTRADALNLVSEAMVENRKDLDEKIKQTVAESPNYHKTDKERLEFINRELGRSFEVRRYLEYKEATMKLQGAKVDHNKLFKPYQENVGIWQGKLLI